MSAIASKITGVSIVYLIVCSSADQRKHPSSPSLAFVRGESIGHIAHPLLFRDKNTYEMYNIE